MKSKTKYVSAEELFAELGYDPNSTENRARIAELLAEQDAVVLSDLRKTAELTQTDLASKLDVSQNRISQIELAELGTIQVETLRNYLAALGGELILGAYINGEIVVIREKAPE